MTENQVGNEQRPNVFHEAKGFAYHVPGNHTAIKHHGNEEKHGKTVAIAHGGICQGITSHTSNRNMCNGAGYGNKDGNAIAAPPGPTPDFGPVLAVR